MNLYRVITIISVICVTLQSDVLSKLALWDRHRIGAGQWWRILTGNFTHTNFPHLIMNLAALWLISYIFRPTGKSLLLCLAFCSAGVGAGLFFTSINVYLGLSGVLHGLFAFCALNELFSGKKSSALLVVGVLIKVGYEQLYGGSEVSTEWIKAQIATQAHLAGMISGFALSLMMYPIRSKSARSAAGTHKP